MSTPIVSNWTHFIIACNYFFVFALFHSLGAQEGFKTFLAKYTSEFFVTYFWRIIYCLVSWYLLYLVFFLHLWMAFANNFPGVIFEYPLWAQFIKNIVVLFGASVVYSAFLQFDYFEFLGLKQIALGTRILYSKYVVGKTWTPPSLDIAGVTRFEVLGIYKYIRHPMLAGGFVMACSMINTVSGCVYLFLFSCYMIIGGYYEEKRLLRNLGEPYAKYMREVGAFFPRFRIFKKPSFGKNHATSYQQ